MSHLMLSRHGIWYYRRVYLTLGNAVKFVFLFAHVQA
jgi:hypothetical protein